MPVSDSSFATRSQTPIRLENLGVCLRSAASLIATLYSRTIEEHRGLNPPNASRIHNLELGAISRDQDDALEVNNQAYNVCMVELVLV